MLLPFFTGCEPGAPETGGPRTEIKRKSSGRPWSELQKSFYKCEPHVRVKSCGCADGVQPIVGVDARPCAGVGVQSRADVAVPYYARVAGRGMPVLQRLSARLTLDMRSARRLLT